LAIAVALSLMASVALASTAGAFGGRGGRGGGGLSGGRPAGGHQSGSNHGSPGSGVKGFNPGFNGFNSGFNGGYNRSFPGLDSFGFRGFSGFRGNAGFGSFIPWGATTTVWPSAPLYDYGYELGKNGYPWQQVPPGWESAILATQATSPVCAAHEGAADAHGDGA
jgi:hypothetical protein